MARTSKNALTMDGLLQESNYLSTIAPYQIPQNWCWTSLGKVCELGKGTSINHKSLPYWDAKSLRGMKEPDIIDSGIVVNAGEKVILVDGENSGEVFPIFEQGYMGSTFRTLHFSKVANEKYATFFIDFHRDQLKKSKIGSAIPHLNKELFFELPFPLPPLAEQQRLVDRIESLFAKLDEAKEKAQAVIDGYEDRRAAILHRAFTNKNKSNWKRATLDEIVSGFKYGTSEKSDYSFSGMPVLRIPNIGDDFIDFSDIKYLMSDSVEDSNRANEGDILIIRSNGSRDLVGKCAIVPHLEREYAFASFLIRIKPSEMVRSDFLALYLNSAEARAQMFTKAKSSAGINNINSKELGAITISLPDIFEQKEIVEKTTKILEKEKQSKEAAEQVIDQIDSMKKSILARAFRGELGTNDPNDESAVELLKRVLVEEQSDDTISKPAIKRTTIPKVIDSQLSTGMERDIIKLIIKADNEKVSMDAIMSLSSKKFEILDTLRALEKKGIIQRNDAGDYSLIK